VFELSLVFVLFFAHSKNVASSAPWELHSITHKGLKVLPVHARKAYMGVGYSSTYSNHDARWQRSVSRPAHLPPGIETAVPSRTLDGSHNRSACFGQETNLLSLWGIEPRFLGRASHFILTMAIEGFRLPYVVLHDCNSSSFIKMIKQRLRYYL